MTDHNSSIKIVVVDDSSFSRNMIIKMLREENFDVIGEAENATEGLKVIQETQPHIVITDIVMPEVSGLELAATLSKSHPQIAIIIISSLSQEHIVIEAIAAGASDFIAKPIEKSVLLDSIFKIVNQKDI